MSRLMKRRPSPAMAVALLALFMSMGGVSYGVATGFIDSREIKDNQIRSRDLRNNEIRTQDLRNNEVRGVDIRNSTIQGRDVALNTLTGSDINETRLGKVPSAAAADRATTAASADSATTAGSVSTLKTIAPITVNGGSSATLATHGPFTVTGACLMPGPEARVEVRTTESGSSVSKGGNEPTDLNPGDVFLAFDAGAGAQPSSGPLTAVAPSGRALSGILASALASASSCKFHGHVVLDG